MNEQSVFISIFVAMFGFICSQMYNHYQKMKHDKEVGKAINALREKGYHVSLDRLAGFDSQTQREMELARSVGYTVLNRDGSSIQVGKSQ